MPMDPKYPQERLRVMLEDAQAPVIVTESALRSHVPPEYAESMTIIEIDSEWDALIGKGSKQNPRIVNESSRDLAYAIYTSGSTGRPKGVMLDIAPSLITLRGTSTIMTCRLTTGYLPTLDSLSMPQWQKRGQRLP